MASAESGPKQSFVYTTYGEHATMPDTVVQSPQRIIRDLLPGQWAMGQPDSVHWDVSSGIFFVDIFDIYEIDNITLGNLGFKAIVQPVVVESESYVPVYIADLRNMLSVMHIRKFEDYKEPFDRDPNLDEHHKKFGRTLLAGVILNDNGTAHWSGNPAYEERGFELVRSVDTVLAKLKATGRPQIAPHALAEYNYGQMDDGMGRAKILDGLHQHSDVL